MRRALRTLDQLARSRDADCAAGAALGLIVLASGLLALGRLRLFARIIGVVAVVMIMLDLFIVLEQTDTEKVGQYISVTRYRAPDSMRFQIQIVLLSLPAVAAAVMASVLAITRRRLRLTVPSHLKEGRKLLVLGQHDAALAEINKAIEISPYLGEAYFQGRGLRSGGRGQAGSRPGRF